LAGFDTGGRPCLTSGHDFVYGELLTGDAGRRKALLAKYERMNQAPLVPYAEVVAVVRDRKLNGGAIGWIDAQVLASALVRRLKPGIADSQLAKVATEVRIAYE
jgi:hypothetical protein